MSVDLNELIKRKNERDIEEKKRFLIYVLGVVILIGVVTTFFLVI